MQSLINVGILGVGLTSGLYLLGSKYYPSFKLHNEVAQIINEYDSSNLKNSKQESVFLLKTNIPENGWVCNLANSAFARSIENLRSKKTLGKVIVKLDNYPYSNRVVIGNLDNDITISFAD